MQCQVLADEGSGVPVVYAPGIDGSGRLMLGGASRIAACYRLVRLRYGAGSDRGHDSYEDLAAAAARALEERRVERALWIAESFGGGVALRVALDHPERVAGLLLVNTFAHYGRRARLLLARLTAPLVLPGVFFFCRNRLAPLALFGRRRDATAIREFRELPGTWFDQAYRRRLALVAGLDLRARLADVGQPVTLVCGDEDRVVDSVRQAQSMQDRLPDAVVHVVRGGGHLLLPLAELPWPSWLAELAQRARLG